MPDWLITDDYTDEALGVLKSGKEAEIFVVERTSLDEARPLPARPQALPTQDGEAQGRARGPGLHACSSFVNDHVYREGRRFRRSRESAAPSNA